LESFGVTINFNLAKFVTKVACYYDINSTCPSIMIKCEKRRNFPYLNGRLVKIISSPNHLLFCGSGVG
jgi:hypothetical protein